MPVLTKQSSTISSSKGQSVRIKYILSYIKVYHCVHRGPPIESVMIKANLHPIYIFKHITLCLYFLCNIFFFRIIKSTPCNKL